MINIKLHNNKKLKSNMNTLLQREEDIDIIISKWFMYKSEQITESLYVNFEE